MKNLTAAAFQSPYANLECIAYQSPAPTTGMDLHKDDPKLTDLHMPYL